MSRFVWAVVAAGVGSAAGCSEDAADGGPRGGDKAGLEDLAQMLQSLPEEGRKPPANPAELGEVEPMIPIASPLLRQGDLVYFWGAGYDPAGKKVVAHEKKAPTEGGYVLLQDGSVTEMSASEFQSAPKAQ